MLTKIYLAVLAVSVSATAFFVFYAWAWLQSIGSPQAAADGYNYHAGLAWTALWATSVVLLVLGNVILARTRRPWAMWATLLYFVVFVIVEYFWLEPAAYGEFGAQTLGRGTGLGTIMAAIMCIGAAVFVYANQYVVVRMADRLHPSVPAVSPAGAEIIPEASSSTDAAQSDTAAQ